MKPPTFLFATVNTCFEIYNTFFKSSLLRTCMNSNLGKYSSSFSLVMLQILWCALIDFKITIKTLQYYFLSFSTVSVEYFANKYFFVLFRAIGQGKEVTNLICHCWTQDTVLLVNKIFYYPFNQLLAS